MMKRSASKPHPFKIALLAGLTTTMLYAGVPDASATGYTVQQINVPGAATRMSDNGAIAGNYVSKCTSFNPAPHEHYNYCYYAPWFYDGKNVTKLGNLWSNSRSAAAAINDSLQMTGSDGKGPWIYSGGKITYMTGGTPVAINNAGVVTGYGANANLVYRAIRFTNGVGTEVLFNDPYLSSPTTWIWTADINDSGLITGWYKDAGNIYQSYVVDTNGTVTFIPNLGVRPLSTVSPRASVRPIRRPDKSGWRATAWGGHSFMS